MYNEMNNLFDLLTKGFNSYDPIKIDLIQGDNNYVVLANLPGVKKENVEISFENGYLSIFVKANEAKEDVKYIVKERENSEKKRQIYLGDIEVKNIKAKMADGVLTVTIALKEPEEKQIHKIVIE